MVLAPPPNRLSRWPRDPIRRPTAAHGAGAPFGFDGLFSTDSEPQCAHRPRALTRTAHTSSALIVVVGMPDISRGPFAFLAFFVHQPRLSAGVVPARKPSQEVNIGGGGGSSASSGGRSGAGLARARISGLVQAAA